MRTKTPTGVEFGEVALHTVTGLKRRRRKGLEPSRRLSETTGPQSPSAFRVVVRVTERMSWCKSPAVFITPGAPRPGAFPQRTRAAAHVPPNTGALRTRYRGVSRTDSGNSAGTTADAVRIPVNGAAVTGEIGSAGAMRRGDARYRLSRRGQARRTPP
ncbi:MAG: hypothetical protein GKR94_05940 [Gammaproteobacteria bacterium]|nr:hypothetical protein [Gammaproteobacteria bacterium]